jgi:CopA family copper-resistance protein
MLSFGHPHRIPGKFFLAALSQCLLTSLATAGTYHLTIDKHAINLVGADQYSILANNTLPAPTLHWHEGEFVTLQVTNNLDVPSSLHWHGILLPHTMDGVPGISFPGIAPKETFTYRFQVRQNGTYWYHGHSGMQEQLGLYGALIIDPVNDNQPVARDVVVILSDWPEADPDRTLARLKKQSGYYNFQKRTLSDFFADVQKLGLWETLSDRMDWGRMRMDPTDLADVTGATYHFLINGQPPDKNWTTLFKSGEKLRLRFINASAMTYFDVRIPKLKMRVLASDGIPVMPVDIDEFRIAVAETYDVLVEPEFNKAYSIFAEAMDRSGYALATLTSDSRLKADIPELRPRTLLTMADMGVAHSGHANHEMPDDSKSSGNTDHEHQHQHMEPPTTANMNHSMMHHQHTINMDMTAIETHQVLSYQHLKAANPSPDLGKADREITMRLTGNMYRYIWSFDDIKYSDSEPIRVHLGDHIRFNYVNETMMNHPIHLHGLWQYLDNGNGIHNPKKHVINVKPGTKVSVDVIADAPGEWAFHCHLLYHMDTGMFRKLIVEPAIHQPS